MQARHRKPRGNRRIEALLVFGTSVGGLVWLAATTQRSAAAFLGTYGVAAITYLLLKMVAAFEYRTYRGPVPDFTVAVVVPAYNEDPVMLAKCLRSLARQTRPAQEIFVIDDGSADERILLVAKRALEGFDGTVRLHRLPENRGKRHAQHWAFTRTDADIILTVDSDTIFDANCIQEGLRPFRDSTIQAVCGNVRVLNDRVNLLTRLLALRYTNAFVYERAAYSKVDSMLCATGVCTFWRSEIIFDNLDDYIHQTFLGVEVSYGDDRRLTNYALARGRVVLQDSAICHTLAPERMTHFLKQQARWNKSFFRETIYAIRQLPKRRMVWWFAVGELALWLFFSGSLISTTIIEPLVTGRLFALYYIGFMILMSYARSARHATHRFAVFLLAPIYALLHVLLLTPVRVWSLLTLRNGAWGTRDSGIEVTATGQPAVTG